MKIIGGTTCSDCYGIFAHSECGGYEIGIRPLVFAQGPVSFLGFRVRAVPKQSENDTNVVDLKSDMAKNIVAAFPGVTFMKADEIRASFVGGIQFGISGDNIMALKEIFQSTRFASKLIQNLSDMIGKAKGVMVDEDEIYEWVVNQYLSEIGDIANAYGAPSNAPEIELEKDPSEVVVPLFKTETVAALTGPESEV